MPKVVVIANFCGNMDGTDNNRFLSIAEVLSKETDVELITSDFNHIRKTHRLDKINSSSYSVRLIHENGYRKNISLARFMSHFLWGINVRIYLRKIESPDLVYSAIPSLTAAYLAGAYCKKKGIKYIVDIQDLWPETFRIAFNYPIISDIALYPFACIARKAYSYADVIFSVSKTYANYAKTICNSSDSGTHEYYIGTDLKAFDLNVKEYYDEASKYLIHGMVNLVYCGTLGKSYDIKHVIDALTIVNKKSPRVSFIVLGDGPQQKEFQEYAEERDPNVHFYGRVEYGLLCAILSRCDIAVNPIVKKSVASIINKHGDYAAAGIPVINSQNNEEYRNLILEYGMGINCDCENSEQIADAIVKMVENPMLRMVMGKKSRKCAEEKFDRNITYAQLCKDVYGVING